MDQNCSIVKYTYNFSYFESNLTIYNCYILYAQCVEKSYLYKGKSKTLIIITLIH